MKATKPTPGAPSYPRPGTMIQQVEVTSRCNLKCPYCPHYKMARRKEDMTLSIFDRVIQWMEHFADQGTQGRVALCGIGEPLLNPDFVEMCARLRTALPFLPVLFSTNGLLLVGEEGERLCAAFAELRITVDISLHRPEIAGRAVENARKYGVLGSAAVFAATASVDWAGQVDWAVSAPTKGSPCPWLFNGGLNVLSDGTFSACCFDTQPGRVPCPRLGVDHRKCPACGGSGLILNPDPMSGAIGHVNDPLGHPVMTRPFGLCTPCHHVVD